MSERRKYAAGGTKRTVVDRERLLRGGAGLSISDIASTVFNVRRTIDSSRGVWSSSCSRMR